VARYARAGSDSATARCRSPKPSAPAFRRWPNPAWNEGDGARTPIQGRGGFDQVEPQMPEPPPRPMRPLLCRRSAPPDAGAVRNGGASPLRSDPLAGFLPPEPMGGRPEPPPRTAFPSRCPSRVTSRKRAADTASHPRSERSAEGGPRSAMGERPRRAPPPTRRPRRPRRYRARTKISPKMAQRLEAALRRPAGAAAEPRVGAPPVAPEAATEPLAPTPPPQRAVDGRRRKLRPSQKERF